MQAKILGVLSALTASICCTVPLLGVTLGLGSLGLTNFIGRYHGYLILAASLFLCLSWRSYFKEKIRCRAQQCPSKGKKATLIVLILCSGVFFYYGGSSLYFYLGSIW